MMENGITSRFNYSELTYDKLKSYDQGSVISITFSDDSLGDLEIVYKEKGDQYIGPKILVLISKNKTKRLKWFTKFQADYTYIPEFEFESNADIAAFCYSRYVIYTPENKESKTKIFLSHREITNDEIKKDPVGTVYEANKPNTNNKYFQTFYQGVKIIYKNDAGVVLRYSTNAREYDFSIHGFSERNYIGGIRYTWVEFSK